MLKDTKDVIEINDVTDSNILMEIKDVTAVGASVCIVELHVAMGILEVAVAPILELVAPRCSMEEAALLRLLLLGLDDFAPLLHIIYWLKITLGIRLNNALINQIMNIERHLTGLLQLLLYLPDLPLHLSKSAQLVGSIQLQLLRCQLICNDLLFGPPPLAGGLHQVATDPLTH